MESAYEEGEGSSVLIRRLSDDELSKREIRISCPDATGLGVDLTRQLLDFGLRIRSADISTDGSWCFLILKVELSAGIPPRWNLLKSKLEQIIPTSSDAIKHLWHWNSNPKEQEPFALQVSSYDRTGMLHALSHALWEADVTVIQAHITTSQEGHVFDTFWIYDNREELPDAHRTLEICDRVKGVLGPEAECSIVSASPEDLGPRKRFRMACKDAVSQSSLRLAARQRREGGSGSDASYAGLSTTTEPSSAILPEDVEVEIDNDTSSRSTLLTLRCRDRKGLLYDLFRAFKEVGVKVAYIKLDALPNGNCEADLFVQDVDGGRIYDEELLEELIGRVRSAAALPVVVQIRDAGEEGTELTVCGGLDAGGRGRPRVTFDVTQGLSSYGLAIDKADVFVSEGGGDNSPSSEPVEMHRFFVHLPDGRPLKTNSEKKAMHDVVCAALMGLQSPATSTELTSAHFSSLENEAPAGPSAALSSANAGGVEAFVKREGVGNSSLILRTLSSKWKGK